MAISTKRPRRLLDAEMWERLPSRCARSALRARCASSSCNDAALQPAAAAIATEVAPTLQNSLSPDRIGLIQTIPKRASRDAFG
jgi:hypothetical protein